MALIHRQHFLYIYLYIYIYICIILCYRWSTMLYMYMHSPPFLLFFEFRRFFIVFAVFFIFLSCFGNVGFVFVFVLFYGSFLSVIIVFCCVQRCYVCVRLCVRVRLCVLVCVCLCCTPSFHRPAVVDVYVD